MMAVMLFQLLVVFWCSSLRRVHVAVSFFVFVLSFSSSFFPLFLPCYPCSKSGYWGEEFKDAACGFFRYSSNGFNFPSDISFGQVGLFSF